MSARPSRQRLATTSAVVWLALCAVGCTRQLYDGPALPPSEVAVIHVGDTTVLNVDDRFGFALPVGAKRFEVAPGRHRVKLAYDKPATTIGLRDIPAHRGEGFCVVDFVAEAGRQYQLGSRAVGTDWTVQRWDGKWEAWVRDPSLSEGNDIVGRCTSSLDDSPPPRITPMPAPGTVAKKAATPTPAPRSAAAPTPTPASPPRVVPVPPAPASVAPVPPASASAPRVVPVPPAPGAPPPAVAPVTTPEAAVDSIRLGTWNLPPLTGGERDYAVTAAVIEAEFDVLTLTELAAGDYGRLLSELGAGWNGMSTGGDDAGDREQYAILYRRQAVRSCPGWQDLRRSTVDGLSRQPAYACFEVGGYAGTPAFDFLLAAYRAVSAEDAGAVAAEVRHLDTALDEMAIQRSGERDIIVAGQFHLEASELALVTNAAVRSEGGGASLNLLGEPSSALRDHILVRDARATREISTPGAAVDVRGFAASPQDFRNTVSDHLPVVVQIDIPARDDD